VEPLACEQAVDELDRDRPFSDHADREACFAARPHGDTPRMQVLGLILIGIVIGILARLVLPGRQHIGVLMTVLLGVGGALVGGIVASAIDAGSVWELNFVGTIVGIIAAILLIAAAESFGVGGSRSRRAF
jgi:uncharacterized membrane protein YeaQ/YmgE (transglycosylase-associated protein family)